MPIIEAYLSDADTQVFEQSVKLSSLAITPSVEDISFLKHQFKISKWTLYTAASYREGMDALRWNRMPVVLCASKLPDGNWKDVLSQLAPIPDRPRLIVFSRSADDELWGEVLDAGGFDVLATPFQDTKLKFTIASAWLEWKGEQECKPLRKSSHA